MKRQPEQPLAFIAVRQRRVFHLQQRTPPDEVRIDEREIEMRAVGVLPVDEGDFGRGAEEIALDEPDLPRLVAPDTRVARLRLRAPAVGRHDAHREIVAGLRACRIHADGAEHAQRPQCALALLEARRVERISRVQQQPAPNHPLPRPQVQPVREIRDPVRRRVLALEDVAVLDDDGVDRLNGVR